MKILWIVNILMPKLANEIGAPVPASGTWLFDIAERLEANTNIELAIACVYGDCYKKIKIGETAYYLLPGNGKDMLQYNRQFEKTWEKVEEEFSPDIIHIHGTEYSHGLSYMRRFPNKKYVLSIQGILNRVKDVDFGGLSLKDILINRTISEWVHFNGMVEMHFLHKINSKYETEMIKRSRYANCVNFWDESLTKYINPDIKVFNIEYNLRNEFYNSEKWKYENTDKLSVFTNPGGTPLKGIHNLLAAIKIVKEKYDKVSLYIPGMGSNSGEIVVKNGYTKYLSKLVDQFGLKDNVHFLGRHTTAQMIQRMLKANVVVVPSAIEGTSLVLREAMFLGCPCIAAFRGGMADFINDKENGFLYDYQEVPYLAGRIIEVFEMKENAEIMGNKAITKAKRAHDRDHNYRSIINMYDMINNA